MEPNESGAEHDFWMQGPRHSLNQVGVCGKRQVEEDSDCLIPRAVQPCQLTTVKIIETGGVETAVSSTSFCFSYLSSFLLNSAQSSQPICQMWETSTAAGQLILKGLGVRGWELGLSTCLLVQPTPPK